MGAYAYCDKCEHSLHGPWYLTTGDLLRLLFVDDFGIKCPGCGEERNYFHYDSLIDELEDRIDKGRTE